MNEEIIRANITKFRWYQPVEFGNGVRTANWAGPHTAHSPEFGLAKWDFIIRRNLADVQGKRVLDLGCNCGLYCIQLARAGAREVVGVDSEETWPSWHAQAMFVKEAIEWRCQAKYNIRYVDARMAEIPSLGLGRFDLAMALCSIYYLSDREILDLLSHLRSSGCPTVLLQGNINRGEQPPEVQRRAAPRFLAEVLRRAGYPNITVDAPYFYSRPVVVGAVDPAEPLSQSRRDKMRAWLRRMV